MGLVHRPYKIKLNYLDPNQKEHTEIFKGFEATVLSHEYDHLDGILHMDIAEKVLVMPREERIEFRKTHDYKVLSKTGDFTAFKRK